MGLDTKTSWLTDRQSQCDFNFDFEIRHTEKEITEQIAEEIKGPRWDTRSEGHNTL
jgi:hypothetical protein